MFTIERIQRIRKILVEKKRIEVSELSQIFNLSESTIRRDLDKLEKEGFLKKTYGGAVLADGYTNYYPDDHETDERDKIARMAIEMVAENDAVFLSGGPICQRLASLLADKKQSYTVITNDLEVAIELSDASHIFVKVTGGDLIHGTAALAGPGAIASLQGVCFNKAFITPTGADLKFGYAVSSQHEALLLQEVLKITREPIVLMDHTPFGRVAFSPIVELAKLPTVVTSNLIPLEYKSFYLENQVKIFTAFEIVHPGLPEVIK